MWADVRLAVRNARRRPAYAATCIAVLAFGLGACTAVFSALYSAVLKPLPYPDPDHLAIVQNHFRNAPMRAVGASAADYFNLREHHELFLDAGVYYFLDLNLSGVDVPRKVNAVAISSSLFDVLGAHPLLGRTFSEVEQRFSGPHAVILSESYWESEFARNPRILQRSLRLNGELYPIVGVMPKWFAFPNDVTGMWTPLTLRDSTDDKSFYLRMYARLAPRVDFSRASAMIAGIGRANPELRAQQRDYLLKPVLRNGDASARRWLWILFAAAGCLLLIVCSNVAGLVLARSSEQRSDLAVRMALGANRWRIARQVLAEVLFFDACGAIAALVVARAAIALLARYGPAAPPQMEAPVFLFCLLVSLATGIVCGIYPAIDSSRTSLIEAGRQQTTGRERRRWQQALIVLQTGVATALLIGGGLLIHSLLLLLETPLGFDPQDVLTMQISLPRARYATPDSRARFYGALFDQVSAVPGVDAASGCTLLPFGFGENVNTFEIAGRPKPAANQYVDLSTVSANYFEAMRIPLLRGRLFTAQDRSIVLIDETFARRVFPNEDPLGRQVKMNWGVYTIAGVVGPVKVSAIDLDTPPTLYFSSAQTPVTDLTLAIRSRLAGNEIVRDVRRIVSGLDRDQPIYDVATLQSRIDRSLKTRRFVVWLMLGFAAAGTGLTMLGLYGLLSYAIILRRREIGIRMAVGASAATIATLICRDGMKLVLAGVALGSVAALAAYRLIASQMYGISLADRATWIGVFAIVFASGFAATAVPALRAARSNIVRALQ
ncbi:MAG TPA: ABC transporter permease [Bryobacteraceae bacterium]|nr:ABC transporter permease [Bryobacteraceae bacterium]